MIAVVTGIGTSWLLQLLAAVGIVILVLGFLTWVWCVYWLVRSPRTETRRPPPRL